MTIRYIAPSHQQASPPRKAEYLLDLYSSISTYRIFLYMIRFPQRFAIRASHYYSQFRALPLFLSNSPHSGQWKSFPFQIARYSQYLCRIPPYFSYNFNKFACTAHWTSSNFSFFSLLRSSTLLSNSALSSAMHYVTTYLLDISWLLTFS